MILDGKNSVRKQLYDCRKGGRLDILTGTKSRTTMAGTCDGFIHAEPLNVCKRIGSTTYEVEVYVKKGAGETAEDKIIRLIKNDLNLALGHGKINLPQTDRLPERGSV